MSLKRTTAVFLCVKVLIHKAVLRTQGPRKFSPDIIPITLISVVASNTNCDSPSCALAGCPPQHRQAQAEA